MGTYFISYTNLIKRLKKELGYKYDEDLLNDIIEMGFVTFIFNENGSFFLEEDVLTCKIIMDINYNISEEIENFFGFRCDLFFNIIKLGEQTYIRTMRGEKKKKIPTYIKYISSLAFIKCEKASEVSFFEIPGGDLISNNEFVIRYCEQTKRRKDIIENAKINDFANTSTYMGKKNALMEFIIESISPYCHTQTIFLDIMCGSGSVSNVFSRLGKTYASDAQHFCTLLAKVQGKGLTVNYVSYLLKKIYPYYIKNIESLNSLLSESICLEEEIFYMDSFNIDNVYYLYEQLILKTKLYSSTENVSSNISALVKSRKQNNKMFPYCLFSTYYSNVYFGIQQCIQIDSIRYAIDQISDMNGKEWLLGILVITVSAVATNFGGHFAQPIKVNKENIITILEKRKKSAWLEFSKRSLEIAAESEKKTNCISIIPGPCKKSLDWLEKRGGKDVIVYLDAPYKREDYSRYYHVLETLVLYDYPSCEYKGRNRSLHNGERFRSEFSTRSIAKVERQFVEIIKKILAMNSICAWSYSNNGNADIIRVINGVKNEISCEVHISSTVHKHNGQGKRIIEYCVIFKNKKMDGEHILTVLKK